MIARLTRVVAIALLTALGHMMIPQMSYLFEAPTQQSPPLWSSPTRATVSDTTTAMESSECSSVWCTLMELSGSAMAFWYAPKTVAVIKLLDIVTSFNLRMASFYASVKDYLLWLGHYWTSTYKELALEAKNRVEDLDEEVSVLVRKQQEIQRICLNPPAEEDRSKCIDYQMGVADDMGKARMERKRARKAYKDYKAKHEWWYGKDA